MGSGSILDFDSDGPRIHVNRDSEWRLGVPYRIGSQLRCDDAGDLII
jgi:hypothetical protein